MLQINTFNWKWLMFLFLLYASPSFGEDVEPCFIFSGNSDTNKNVSLSSYNRIYFDNNGMTLSSPNEDINDELRLSYSDFHHIMIGLASPDVSTGVETTVADAESYLEFMSDSKALAIHSPSEKIFKVGLYDLSGNLVAVAQMQSDDTLTLERLSPNTYIAIATDGETKMTLKFIIH